MNKIVKLGEPVDRVPTADSVMILRNGVVSEVRLAQPILDEEDVGEEAMS